QEEIAGGGPSASSFTASSDTQPLILSHARRDFHLVGFGFLDLPGPAALIAQVTDALSGAAAFVAGNTAFDGNGAHGSIHRLFERDQHVAFEIAAFFRGPIFRLEARSATESAKAAARAEKLLEEIAKTGAAELEFEFLPS